MNKVAKDNEMWFWSYGDKLTDKQLDEIHKSYRKNEGKPAFSNVDPEFLLALMEGLMVAEAKYPPVNGQPNYKVAPIKCLKRDVLDSAFRHMLALYKGEAIDPDSGVAHEISVAANMMIYFNRKGEFNG